MHPNLTGSAFSHDALTPMTDHILELLIAHFGENFGQSGRGAARRILLHAMVEFDDFQIETRPENLSGFASQPKEGVHSGRIVRSPDDRNARNYFRDLRFFRLTVAGGSNHQGFLMFGTDSGDAASDLMEAEVDRDVGPDERRLKVVALINLADYLEFSIAGGATEQGLAHSALIADNREICHTAGR